MLANDAFVWTPSPRRAEQSQLRRFLAGHRNYDELWRWSVERPEEFWPAVWRFCGVRSSRLWDDVGTGGEWFRGAQLNYAQNVLRYQDDEPALAVNDGQSGRRVWTHRQLHDETSRLAQALHASGVSPADTIAGYLPDGAEAVIAMLATASLGATWTACPLEMDVDGAARRLRLTEPRVLIGTGAQLGGLAHSLPTVRLTIGADGDNVKAIGHALRWRDEIAFYPARALDYAIAPFSHPLVVTYTPDGCGVVHGAGGTLLEHLKELVLHADVRAADRLLVRARVGDGNWYWRISALATGACVQAGGYDVEAASGAVLDGPPRARRVGMSEEREWLSHAAMTHTLTPAPNDEPPCAALGVPAERTGTPSRPLRYLR